MNNIMCSSKLMILYFTIRKTPDRMYQKGKRISHVNKRIFRFP